MRRRAYTNASRIYMTGGAHMHAAWESQPMVRSTDRGQRRGVPVRAAVALFLLGLILGLLA